MKTEKPRRLKKAGGRTILRRGVVLVLLAVFLVSGTKVLLELMDYRRGEESYGEAEKLVNLPDFSLLTPAPVPSAKPSDPAPTPTAGESPAPVESGEPDPTPTPYVDPYASALSAMDFAALREVNGEVVGWLVIPGTQISYPLLQGEDNSYYLNHTWKRERSVVGAIFLEHTNSSDLSDFNTIIYGHNMKNGSMFGALQNYRDGDFLAAHPSVYLTVDGGSYRYDIFAAYEASVDSSTYQIGFSGEESRQAFLDDCLSRSGLSTEVTPHTWDRILTLSTCTPTSSKDSRWVIQAVWAGEPPPGEDPSTEETTAPEA